MKNKGLIISLVVFTGILVMLLVTFILYTFPDTTSNLIKKKKVESVRPTIAESVPETTQKQEIGYSISHFTYNEGMNVDIEYPVIYGMENEEYQNNINQKLHINASSILLLHEDKDKIENFNVFCTVQDFDEEQIVVTYEGEIFYKTNTKTSNSKSSTKKSQSSSSSRSSGSSKSSSPNVSGDPNYDTYGGYTGNQVGGATANYDSYNNYSNTSQIPQYNTNQTPQYNSNQFAPSNSGYDTYAPISGQNNNVQMYPGANNIMNGFASTKQTSKKVFYSNTVNLNTCEDIYLSQYSIIPELSQYIKSASCDVIAVDEESVVNLRKYIQKLKLTDVQKILQNADFKNNDLKEWPKSFSYKKGNYIYFTLPVSSELGDYALVRYAYGEE